METIQKNVKRNGNGETRKVRAAPRRDRPTETKVESAMAETKVDTWLTADKETSRTFEKKEMHALSNADADKAIRAIRTSGKSLKAMAHKTACGIMLHYVEHGDFTKLYNLLSAVRDAMSKRMANGLVKWVVAFTSLQYDADKAVFTNRKGQTRFFHLDGIESGETKWHKEGALNHPFYSANFGDDDAAPHEFNAEKYIAETLQRMFDKLASEIAAKEKAETEKRKRDAAKIKVDSVQIDAVKAMAKMAKVTLDLAKATPANVTPA